MMWGEPKYSWITHLKLISNSNILGKTKIKKLQQLQQFQNYVFIITAVISHNVIGQTFQLASYEPIYSTLLRREKKQNKMFHVYISRYFELLVTDYWSFTVK